MRYRATIYAQGYFGHFLTALFVLMLCVLISTREYFTAAALSAAVALVSIRVYTRRMSFDDQVFRYDGWFGPIQIPYSEIIKVETSSSLGYPADRWHGASEYRITTKYKRWWVSLLWFNSEAIRHFEEHIAKRK
jgi:hypothetical protein